MRYSPDGRRLIVVDYEGGVIQVWDTDTGKQLTKIETHFGTQGRARDFLLSPEWKTLYVPRSNRKTTRIEKDGQRMVRWEFDSDVRSWDLANGEPLQTLKPNPPHNILILQLSPDGATFLTGEQLPGDYERSPPRVTSLRDVKTHQFRPLPDKVSVIGTFAPDSRTIAITSDDRDGYSTAVKLFAVATAEEKLSISITVPFTSINISSFSPDGRLLMGSTRSYPARNNWESWELSLKLWDVASGREVASFVLDEKKSDFNPVFSPDGRIVAATNWRGDEAKVFLFDLPSLKLLRTIRLGVKAIQGQPEFSPDGKWLAVQIQAIPEDSDNQRAPVPEDRPQPRVHLIDVEAGTVLETIVAPQAFATSMCFSPDGKTLATAGKGKVLLWDLTKPLGVVGGGSDN